MKDEPLLAPGLHEVQEVDLENHFLSEFANSETRDPLINGLKEFFRLLETCGIKFEVWLDGSFTTRKENPNDIDLVVFADPAEIDKLDRSHKKLLKAVFGDRTGIRNRFGCDAFFAPSNNTELRSYWRGWFGFDRNEGPKGIARISLDP